MKGDDDMVTMREKDKVSCCWNVLLCWNTYEQVPYYFDIKYDYCLYNFVVPNSFPSWMLNL